MVAQVAGGRPAAEAQRQKQQRAERHAAAEQQGAGRLAALRLVAAASLTCGRVHGGTAGWQAAVEQGIVDYSLAISPFLCTF